MEADGGFEFLVADGGEGHGADDDFATGDHDDGGDVAGGELFDEIGVFAAPFDGGAFAEAGDGSRIEKLGTGGAGTDDGDRQILRADLDTDAGAEGEPFADCGGEATHIFSSSPRCRTSGGCDTESFRPFRPS